MDTFGISLLVFTIIAYLGLGFLSILHTPRGSANRILLSLSIVASIWSFSVLMVNIHHEVYELVLLWIRLSHSAAILLPWHVYALTMALFHSHPFSYKSTTFLLAGSLILSGVSFSPYFVSGLEEPFTQRILQLGMLSIPYYGFYVGAFSYAIYHLFHKLSLSRGLLRLQISYFAIGTIITLFFSSLANVILPLIGIITIADVDVRNLGPAFSLIMIGSISYSVVRYRFLDIRFALRKGIAKLIAFLIIAAGLIIIAQVSFDLGLSPSEFTVGAGMVFSALIVIIFLSPLAKKSQTILDKYFFKKVSDYHNTLIKKVKRLVGILSFEDVLKSLTMSIVENMDLEKAFFCWREKYRYLFSSPINNDPLQNNNLSVTLKHDSFIINFISDYKEILLQTDLKNFNPPELRVRLDKEFEKEKVEAVVPLLTDNKVEGILFLGRKLSGEPYFEEDVQLLSMIAGQTSVALKNARLYQDLLAVKQYLEEILTHMGNGLIAINDQNIITIFNSEAQIITGITAEQALNKEARLVLNDKLYKIYKGTLSTGISQNEVEVKLSVGNETLHISCSTSIINKPGGESREVIMVLSNITLIKTLEREKNQAERLASLGEIAAGIAHEIKNPLVSIKTFAELLPDKYDDHEFRHNYSQVVRQEIERINNLVSELLNFVRESDLDLKPVHLTSLLDEVIMLLYPQIEKQQITVQKEYEDHHVQVVVDRNLIKQAIINILLNAIYAMTGGGELKIGLYQKHSNDMPKVDHPEDYINQIENNTYSTVLIIEDTGMGIPESIRDKIFDPFVTNKADGVGIGLSISHKIISAHNGRISFTTSEGRGTRFEIALP